LIYAATSSRDELEGEPALTFTLLAEPHSTR